MKSALLNMVASVGHGAGYEAYSIAATVCFGLVPLANRIWHCHPPMAAFRRALAPALIAVSRAVGLRSVTRPQHSTYGQQEVLGRFPLGVGELSAGRNV